MTATRIWAKIDVFFFEKTADLTTSQQVAFLRLILSCKRRRNDGLVDAAALKAERVSSAVLGALIEKGLVCLNGTGWVIPDYADWQGTTKELSEKRAEAGRRGAERRWGS